MNSKYVIIVTMDNPFKTVDKFVNKIDDLCLFIIFTSHKFAYSTIMIMCNRDIDDAVIHRTYSSQKHSTIILFGLATMLSHLDKWIITECLKYRSCNISPFTRMYNKVHFDEFLVYMPNTEPIELPDDIELGMNIPGQVSHPAVCVINNINIVDVR